MMHHAFTISGEDASFNVEILQDEPVQAFITEHAGVLNSAMETDHTSNGMSDAMRQSFERSNYIFSGMKTFHELNEAFPSMLDENGNRKPFEQFLNDVQQIDKTYNEHHLRTEYNFVHQSAQMAEKWETFEEDGDDYYLQYRTTYDGKVRPEHAALHGVTLPPSDSFWDMYYPPNGWGCRCTVVQVLKDKYDQTPHNEAMRLGEGALEDDRKQFFRFNAGKERKSVPDYNPYTQPACRNCNIVKGKLDLAFLPSNLMCSGCKIINECYNNMAKSERAVLKKHYMEAMKPLLHIKQTLATDTGSIRVGFSKYGNEHLYSDTFGRSRILHKEDLATLDKVLANASYIDQSALTHPRTDNIDRFYYFEGEINGRKVRLNVARERWKTPKGKRNKKIYLYSINDL